MKRPTFPSRQDRKIRYIVYEDESVS